MRRLIALFSLSLVFIAVEIIIKFVAFNISTVFFELGPKLCLWSAATLSGLAMNEQISIDTGALRKLHREVSKISADEISKYIEEKKPCLLYLNFLCAISLALWVTSVVLSANSLCAYNELRWSLQACFYLYGSIISGLTTVVIAITSVKDGVIYGWLRK
ncbi:MAG: hypothetical protein K0R55_1828 [Sporomusa sp.]|jgi:hypothetical protein|nr:hypothetical protein [Sporomusa sp.]